MRMRVVHVTPGTTMYSAYISYERKCINHWTNIKLFKIVLSFCACRFKYCLFSAFYYCFCVNLYTTLYTPYGNITNFPQRQKIYIEYMPFRKYGRGEEGWWGGVKLFAVANEFEFITVTKRWSLLLTDVQKKQHMTLNSEEANCIGIFYMKVNRVYMVY